MFCLGDSDESDKMIVDDNRTITTKMTSIIVNENNDKLNKNECDTKSYSSGSSSDSGVQLCAGNKSCIDKEPMSTFTLPSNFILTAEESADLSRDQIMSTPRRLNDETVTISNEQNASITGNFPTFVQHVENSVESGNAGEMCHAPHQPVQQRQRSAVFDVNVKILNVQPTDSIELTPHSQLPNLLQTTLLSERDPHFTVSLKEQSRKYMKKVIS